MMTQLLDLPVELLQHVAGFSPDLTNLRLVCHTLNSAVPDQFGKRYLSELQCFVLDPRRLQRMKSITSQKHLVSKVDRVCFTLDPLEGKPSQRGEDRFVEHWGAPEKQACRTYTSRVPDLTSLESILGDIRIAGRARVDIAFAGYRRQSDDPVKHVRGDKERARIYERILTSGCKLSGLELDLARTAFLTIALHQRPLSRRDAFLEESRSWESLRIDIFEQKLPDQTLISMLGPESALQALTIVEDGPFLCSGDTRLPIAQPSTNVLMTAISSAALRKVDISCMTIDPTCLYQALQSWSKSLRSLALRDIYLPSPGRHWLKIFELLHSSLLDLDELTLTDLVEESRTNIGPDGSLIKGYVELQEFDEDVERSVTGNLELKGRERIRNALWRSVESGLVDTW